MATEVLAGTRKALYVAIGLGCVVLGALGAILPLLPTTPFLLLASYFFVRSSPRLHAWLLRNRLFGPFLRDWEVHRGVRRPVKITAICMILLVGGVSAASGKLPLPLLIGLFALLATGLLVVVRLRTIGAETQQPALLPIRLVDEGEVSSEEGRPGEFIEISR